MPAPVEPMMAMVSPGSAVNVTSSSTGVSAPGYVKLTDSNSTVPSAGAVHSGAAGDRAHSVSMTSLMRRAPTAARGIMIVMKVIIMMPIENLHRGTA